MLRGSGSVYFSGEKVEVRNQLMNKGPWENGLHICSLCVHVCVRACMRVCVHVRVCVCACTCMCAGTSAGIFLSPCNMRKIQSCPQSLSHNQVTHIPLDRRGERNCLRPLPSAQQQRTLQCIPCFQSTPSCRQVCPCCTCSSRACQSLGIPSCCRGGREGHNFLILTQLKNKRKKSARCVPSCWLMSQIHHHCHTHKTTTQTQRRELVNFYGV